jgi:hypothetical protein
MMDLGPQQKQRLRRLLNALEEAGERGLSERDMFSLKLGRSPHRTVQRLREWFVVEWRAGNLADHGFDSAEASRFYLLGRRGAQRAAHGVSGGERMAA